MKIDVNEDRHIETTITVTEAREILDGGKLPDDLTDALDEVQAHAFGGEAKPATLLLHIVPDAA